jgi:hypothetical protein
VARLKHERILTYNIFSDTLALATREYLSPYGFPFNNLDFTRNINVNYLVRLGAMRSVTRLPGLKKAVEAIHHLGATAATDPSSVLKKNYKETTLLKLRRSRCSPSYLLLKKQNKDETLFDPFNQPLNFHYH